VNSSADFIVAKQDFSGIFKAASPSVFCVNNTKDKTMKLSTIALAAALMLPTTFALAQPVRHEAGTRTHYYLHRGVPMTGSRGFLRPNDGNPNGNPDGPTTLSGTGSSEFGGSSPGTSGYN
jgi:hypothetical protein